MAEPAAGSHEAEPGGGGDDDDAQQAGGAMTEEEAATYLAQPMTDEDEDDEDAFDLEEFNRDTAMQEALAGELRQAITAKEELAQELARAYQARDDVQFRAEAAATHLRRRHGASRVMAALLALEKTRLSWALSGWSRAVSLMVPTSGES